MNVPDYITQPQAHHASCRDDCQGNPDHDDPVVIGLCSTPGIYYGLCRSCGAYTQIRPSPHLAHEDLRAGLIRGVLAGQRQLPLSPSENDKATSLTTRKVA